MEKITFGGSKKKGKARKSRGPKDKKIKAYNKQGR